ncbi:hypothetical protein EB796_008524 [Bugula neritina]|uniref:Uncharacterized protein n=1 Tax=Bugula neritina TaxID=10212 RepID=A0A7J7K3G6_BUGNE|nr:hypothetical protein EB796_008524 [Bugula neritina]
MYDTYSYYYGEYGNYDGAYYSQNGIVCECCIYGCTPTELSEYCAYKRRKRSVSSSRVPEYFRDFFEDGFEDDFQNYIFEDPVEFSRTSIVQALDQQKALNIKHEN